MKNHNSKFLFSVQNEAQIAASYKKYISNPVKIKKPITDFFYSFTSNANTLSDTNEGGKTDREKLSTEMNEKNHLTLISKQSLTSLQRPRSERPNLCFSKEAAEYEEVPFLNPNKEYETFKKLFQEKVVEQPTGNQKYEKKNKIQEIIENEYNFNKYGEEWLPRSRKNSVRSNSKGRTPRMSSNQNSNNDFNFNLKNKITFTFQKERESIEKIDPQRQKKDKLCFEKLKEKYFLKIKKMFEENSYREGQKLAHEEIERVIKEFKEYIDQTQEEK